jgi:glutathione synthase/RimK-type ligase-like ATP-grasp enzyme
MMLALIGYQVQDKYNNGTVRDEDQDLFDYLSKKGLQIQREVWNDPKVQWTAYQAVIIKSPWDYHEHHSEFLQWVDYLTSLNIKVFNSSETIRWNSDKHYLQEILASGLPTIPTIYLEKGSTLHASINYFQALNNTKLVIKPCISAGAKNTVLVTPQELPELKNLINEWLQQESYMVQPFVKEILDGEWSLLFFGGKYSHSLLKTPKDQDFRVQHYLGGKVDYREADEDIISQAQKFVERFAADTLYARIDGVLINGVFHLMEMELIEPYLFLDNNPLRMEKYYQALTRILNIA